MAGKAASVQLIVVFLLLTTQLACSPSTFGFQCTVGVVGTAATVTFQGPGAGNNCTRALKDQKYYEASQEPNLPVICEYSEGLLHVRVRDEAAPKPVSTALCQSLEKQMRPPPSATSFVSSKALTIPPTPYPSSFIRTPTAMVVHHSPSPTPTQGSAPSPAPSRTPVIVSTAAPSPTAASEAPAQVVAAYYQAIDDKDYPTAWALMDQQFQKAYPYDEFSGWFKDKLSIRLDKVEWAKPEPGSDGYQVQAIVSSVDRVDGQVITARYREDWALKQEGSYWKIDRFEGNEKVP